MEEDQEHKHPNNILLFRLAISNNLKCIAESVSEDAFREILTILKSKPNIAQKLHKVMINELYDNMKDDLELILDEGSLKEGLEKIAKLSDANSSITEDAWRPPGNVSLHLRSLDAQVIKEESESLEKQVNRMEEENEALMKEIASRRLKINAINDSMVQCLNTSPIAIDLLEKRLEGLQKCVILLDNE
ncbi:hypothetical protein ANTPLA_LOCUS5048 [Anthophora plagiata]